MNWSIAFLVWGAACIAAEPPSHLGTIRVQGNESGLIKRHEIIKTEVITKDGIEHKRAQTLAEAVSNQVGVDAQNSCANCGSKRVTINGLRGEHTTILIDGVPMHSAISSFYGLDAVPVVGIEAIEVSRGAGASLIAPEAIGGVVNILTSRPKETGLNVQGSYGNGASGFASLLGSWVSGSGKHSFVFAGQLSHQGFWDIDANGVSEAPNLSNQSFFVKVLSELTESDKLEARYARQTVGILGGTTDGTRPTTYVTNPGGTPPSFTSSDTSQTYLDSQNLVTDVVGLARHEGMARWSHFFEGGTQFQFTSSAAEQKQTSLYMHGYDYRNRDWLIFEDARLLFSVGDNHFFTLGAELKNQDMSSQSDKLYVGDGLPNDGFSYRSRAGYVQYVWVPWENLELSSALRLDSMQVNWHAQTAKEFEIDQVLLAPRLHLKWQHAQNWTSRLMYGRGYRPPLSFFESQHGLNEYGFSVQITDIEKSHALGYSLAYTEQRFALTASSHYTWLAGMAFADGDVTAGDPAIFKNSSAEYQIWANDVLLSWNPQPNWNLQLSYEHFSLPSGYKARLPAAAIEQRARLVSDVHWGDWEWVNTVSWGAARDLTAYGYGSHYRTLVDVENIAGDPLSGTHPEVGTLKSTRAPSFFLWDMYLGWKWKKEVSFFASIQNLFNFTQTSAGDSPLNWSTHGADPSHFHLDNNHTWGPLRGRVFSVGLKAEI